MSTNVRSRLEKLESSSRLARRPKRVFRCVVRQHHEEADQAFAINELGAMPTDDDLVIRRVIVSADQSSPMNHIIPRAAMAGGALV